MIPPPITGLLVCIYRSSLSVCPSVCIPAHRSVFLYVSVRVSVFLSAWSAFLPSSSSSSITTAAAMPFWPLLFLHLMNTVQNMNRRQICSTFSPAVFHLAMKREKKITPDASQCAVMEFNLAFPSWFSEVNDFHFCFFFFPSCFSLSLFCGCW